MKNWTHIIPAELQHGSDQSELLVDLLALKVGEDFLEAVADAVHGHVPAEDDTEGEHVKKDTTFHWQLLVARRRLLLGHAVFEGGVVKVHLINLDERLVNYTTEIQVSYYKYFHGGLNNKKIQLKSLT